jgi:hypothetical protein
VATVIGMTCIIQRYILSGMENYYVVSPLLIQYRKLENLMQRFPFYLRSDVTLTESLEKKCFKGKLIFHRTLWIQHHSLILKCVTTLSPFCCLYLIFKCLAIRLMKISHSDDSIFLHSLVLRLDIF